MLPYVADNIVASFTSVIVAQQCEAWLTHSHLQMKKYGILKKDHFLKLGKNLEDYFVWNIWYSHEIDLVAIK